MLQASCIESSTNSPASGRTTVKGLIVSLLLFQTCSSHLPPRLPLLPIYQFPNLPLCCSPFPPHLQHHDLRRVIERLGGGESAGDTGFRITGEIIRNGDQL